MGKNLTFLSLCERLVPIKLVTQGTHTFLLGENKDRNVEWLLYFFALKTPDMNHELDENSPSVFRRCESDSCADLV